jgi:transcriptional regulator with XRE-family HTH domain
MSRRPAAGSDAKVRGWLIDLREQKGMTQGQVAAAAGISQPSYFAIEKGISFPKPETAKKLAAVLGFDLARFYEDEDEGES